MTRNTWIRHGGRWDTTLHRGYLLETGEMWHDVGWYVMEICEISPLHIGGTSWREWNCQSNWILRNNFRCLTKAHYAAGQWKAWYTGRWKWFIMADCYLPVAVHRSTSGQGTVNSVEHLPSPLFTVLNVNSSSCRFFAGSTSVASVHGSTTRQSCPLLLLVVSSPQFHYHTV